jgi:hypothetical protein
MMNQTADCCSSTADRGVSERPRFFPRQLITPDDLTLGQDYMRNKVRRLTRFMFGWGIVCGARVTKPQQAQPWKVNIGRGYILGPYGDEILIERDRCFDLRTRCTTAASGDACAEISDPWCNDLPRDTPKGGKVYIAVRCKEVMSRPVRVQPIGCGCGDNQCEYSRWRDGYEICVLDKCPGSHEAPPEVPPSLHGDTIPDCPDCPDEPWVVLASVTMDDQGSVKEIGTCECRRMMVTMAPYWWRCADASISEPAPTPSPAPAPAPAPVPGGQTPAPGPVAGPDRPRPQRPERPERPER